MHLLPLPDEGRIGIVGDSVDGIIASLSSFGVRTEPWDRQDSGSYDGVVVDTHRPEFNVSEVVRSISSEGFIWIWGSSRNHESILAKQGFDVQTLAALPSLNRPRYMIDPRSGYKSVRASLAFHPASALWLKIAKELYALVAKPLAKIRLGPPINLIATKPADGTARYQATSSTWKQMCELDLRIVHPTVIGASPGNGQKGVLAGASEDGSFHLFCKVADNEHHGIHLTNEASILSDHLSEFEAANLTIPPVIAQSTDHGFTKLFLSSVHGDKLNSSQSLPDSLARSMGTLFAKSHGANPDVQSTASMPQFIEQLIEWNDSDPLIQKACLSAIDDLDYREVPLGLAHRDFVFWNILKNKSGWTVIDWEWARERHIPFQDIFHFYVHGAVNEKGLDPTSAACIINSTKGRHSLETYAHSAMLDLSLIAPLFTLYLCDWIGIQNGLGLSDTEQTVAYRQLLEAVVDGRMSIQ